MRSPTATPKRGREWLRAAIAAPVLLAACDGGDSGPPRADAQAPTRVIAHEVVYAREETSIEVVGTARARASATIYPDASGEVTEVLFAPGEYVEAGDALLRLDAREERLAGELARVAVQEAEQLLARYQRIEGTGAVSASQIDEARTALDASEIQLRQAQVALDKRTVSAPFSGHIGISDIDPGARITSTTVIAELDDRSALYVDFSPPEQVFGRVAVGDMVTVSPFAEAGGAREARITAVDTRIEAARRTFIVRAEIDNSDDRLRPGMSFRVNFSLPGEPYPAIPETAIVWGADGSYVWAVVEGAARRVPVAIVSREQGRVLARADIPEGMEIVVEGVQKMREGAPVEPASAPGPIAAAGAGLEGAP